MPEKMHLIPNLYVTYKKVNIPLAITFKHSHCQNGLATVLDGDLYYDEVWLSSLPCHGLRTVEAIDWFGLSAVSYICLAVIISFYLHGGCVSFGPDE